MKPRRTSCTPQTASRHLAPVRPTTVLAGLPGPASRPTHRGRDVPGDRALFLVDLENLLGDPSDYAGVAEAMGRCLIAGRWVPGDHLVVAGHPHLVLVARTATGLSFQALRAPRGPDGADRALLSALTPAFLADRYHRVVIASGDHAFAGLAAELGGRGIPVWVVGRSGSVAAELRLAAARVVALGSPTPDLRQASRRLPGTTHRRPVSRKEPSGPRGTLRP